MGNTKHIIGDSVFRLVLDGADQTLSAQTVMWANEVLGRKYGTLSGARSTRGQLRSSGVHCHIERAIITWERVD